MEMNKFKDVLSPIVVSGFEYSYCSSQFANIFLSSVVQKNERIQTLTEKK